jgi:type I restriction enzyme S subunit
MLTTLCTQFDEFGNTKKETKLAKIKKDTSLRKAILQAAITGQLIDSRHSELDSESQETGKQLLDRIIEERNKKLLAEWEEKLKENPKTKKPTQIVASEIAENEIPFEIPESWCWCRLGEIGDVIMGQSPDGNAVKESGDGIEFHQGKIFFGDDYLKKSNQITTESTKIVGSDTILLCVRAPVGKVNLLDRDICIGRGLCALRPVISKKFVYYILQALESEFNDKATGTTFKAISKDIIFEQLLPLPPLAVQNAIVAKLEEVLPLVDAYENVVLQKEELKNAISEKVKKAILQEAIQGKLTEDWRKTATIEETGKQLLDRIIEERKKMSHGLDFANAKSGKRKSKKETALAGSNPCDIPEDEIPFEIPESWCWCRLGDVGDWKAGSTPSRSNPEFYNGNIPWLKTGDLTDGFVDSIPEYISEKALESCSMRLNPIGSVLIAMYGATIGKLGILNIEATTNQACCACVTHKPISNKYLFYYLMSQKKSLTEKAEGGAQPNISREKLVIHPFPLPPLAEQNKIVEIIEQMLPLCEKLGG